MSSSSSGNGRSASRASSRASDDSNSSGATDRSILPTYSNVPTPPPAYFSPDLSGLLAVLRRQAASRRDIANAVALSSELDRREYMESSDRNASPAARTHASPATTTIPRPESGLSSTGISRDPPGFKGSGVTRSAGTSIPMSAFAPALAVNNRPGSIFSVSSSLGSFMSQESEASNRSRSSRIKASTAALLLRLGISYFFPVTSTLEKSAFGGVPSALHPGEETGMSRLVPLSTSSSSVADFMISPAYDNVSELAMAKAADAGYGQPGLSSPRARFSPAKRKRKWYLLIFVILLALIVGLAVGLTKGQHSSKSALPVVTSTSALLSISSSTTSSGRTKYSYPNYPALLASTSPTSKTTKTSSESASAVAVSGNSSSILNSFVPVSTATGISDAYSPTTLTTLSTTLVISATTSISAASSIAKSSIPTASTTDTASSSPTSYISKFSDSAPATYSSSATVSSPASRITSITSKKFMALVTSHTSTPTSDSPTVTSKPATTKAFLYGAHEVSQRYIPPWPVSTAPVSQSYIPQKQNGLLNPEFQLYSDLQELGKTIVDISTIQPNGIAYWDVETSNQDTQSWTYANYPFQGVGIEITSDRLMTSSSTIYQDLLLRPGYYVLGFNINFFASDPSKKYDQFQQPIDLVKAEALSPYPVCEAFWLATSATNEDANAMYRILLAVRVGDDATAERFNEHVCAKLYASDGDENNYENEENSGNSNDKSYMDSKNDKDGDGDYSDGYYHKENNGPGENHDSHKLVPVRIQFTSYWNSRVLIWDPELTRYC
ncbi:uncharacterized protein V1516DRAFT_275460 [Lipomyces oligophaga]|uniref:uncharacterized protein n=1 Tax=Lipomyces oligophaga TaxID=45792 RepID=UPI0034D01BA4